MHKAYATIAVQHFGHGSHDNGAVGKPMNDVCLLTPTWSGDREHFALLRASLDHSALADVPHDVVVQTEDMALFGRFGDSVRMWSTADILPPMMEERRVRARALSDRLGHRFTKLAGSLALRTGGWPDWVHYTGWHTQQLAKLAAVAQSRHETVVVMDSDLVVLPDADRSDFIDPQGRTLCFEAEESPPDFSGRQAKWNIQAHRLLDIPYDPERYFDTCFETPFIFHPPTVRALLEWLEGRYGKPWWQSLIEQPVRNWSEFAIYRLFLKRHIDQRKVSWQPNRMLQYLHDASDVEALGQRIGHMVDAAEARYVTIHSQSAGRGRWGADSYAWEVLAQLDQRRAPQRQDGST